MSIIVEHEKRQKEILKKALDVFVDEGFENATFQKIADRCGITRTTLYLYFKNKKEVFNYSIKQLLSKAEEDIRIIYTDSALHSIEKITNVLLNIFQQLEENRRLLSVILDYLLHLSKKNTGQEESTGSGPPYRDPEKRVRRRTLRLRHILASMVIEGIKKGDLKPVDIKITGDYLYSLIEAAIFRLVVLQRKDLSDLRKTTVLAIGQLGE